MAAYYCIMFSLSVCLSLSLERTKIYFGQSAHGVGETVASMSTFFIIQGDSVKYRMLYYDYWLLCYTIIC